MFNLFGRNKKNKDRRPLKAYEITFDVGNGTLVETHIVRFRSLDNLRAYTKYVQNDNVKIIHIHCIDDNADIKLFRGSDKYDVSLMVFCLN